jgi:anti-sigma factor RsiW
MEALEIPHEKELRAHLDSCAACRRYLEEISSVAGKLAAAEPESGNPSESFHRNFIAALAKAKRESAGEALLARMWNIWNWRLAMPAVTAAALVIAAWLVIVPRANIPVSAPLAVHPVSAPGLKAGLEPTFSNYEMAVHQSLDKLDELLTKQGNRNPEPSPIYTAALPPRSNMAE